jgi:hypothetical protein
MEKSQLKILQDIKFFEEYEPVSELGKMHRLKMLKELRTLIDKENPLIKQVTDLKQLLCKIRDITETGGSGSRKIVVSLIDNELRRA